jgi:hypothetical protein
MRASPGWTASSNWRSRAGRSPLQPGPAAGGVWILPAGATGAVWAGQPPALMRFEAGAWEALVAAEGVLAWVKDENQMVAHDGVAWTPLSATLQEPDGRRVAGPGQHPAGDPASRR